MAAPNKAQNVLFLCTGNSARSIMAEAILNRESRGRFNAYSAGSKPSGSVHPYALDLLKLHNYPTGHLRSKSWEELATRDAPTMDFVITVCDQASQEPCPVWPGRPVSAHWSFPDPAAFDGSEDETRAFFVDVMYMIHNRLRQFIALSLESLDRPARQAQLEALSAAELDSSQP